MLFGGRGGIFGALGRSFGALGRSFGALGRSSGATSGRELLPFDAEDDRAELGVLGEEDLVFFSEKEVFVEALFVVSQGEALAKIKGLEEEVMEGERKGSWEGKAEFEEETGQREEDRRTEGRRNDTREKDRRKEDTLFLFAASLTCSR